MTNRKRRPIHQCACVTCRRHPHSAVAKQHRAINRVVAILDERSRRRFVGLLALQWKRGGVQRLVEITGLSRNTIGRGGQEIEHPRRAAATRGIRRPGGGRQRVEKKYPGLSKALAELLKDATAGDPITGLKWTRKTPDKISRTLSRRGFKVKRTAVRRLMRERHYALRVNRKRLTKQRNPDRDRQMRYLIRTRRAFEKAGFPALSVDAKKKELVGNFRNAGRTWRREPMAVFETDFPGDAAGKAIPYGIYDPARNAGYVVIGISHETAEFAVAAIRSWWLEVGRQVYAGQHRLLIQVDDGGANDSRSWLWKAHLQALADEFHLTITVTHFPPGASKWNLIEHRLFSPISGNWEGQPLRSYETILKFIRTTQTESGLHCRARLDKTVYETGLKITAEAKAQINLRPRRLFPHWNYTIEPRAPVGKK